MSPEKCPCKSNKKYADCCQLFIDGGVWAPTPEKLMRSRYTAFCKKNKNYLMATLDPEQTRNETARQQLEKDLALTMGQTCWLGLDILGKDMDGPDRGRVEFVAFFEQDSSLGQLHERSLFIRIKNRWYYTEGQILAPVPLSRNQPCVCGSGKKFKRCYGKK
ncbi:MAG: YchJ family protein [Desulfobacter sp.]|nr:YchJ family protein [Desulfobacter sp.]